MEPFKELLCSHPSIALVCIFYGQQLLIHLSEAPRTLILALPMRCTGTLIVPEAFEHRFSVTRSLHFFLPSADFSKLEAKVTSGSSQKFKPVSSQFNIWLREYLFCLDKFVDTNSSACFSSLDNFSLCKDS